MHPALSALAICVAVPLACLGLMMWLAWLEDTLEESVAKAVRRPAPEPILAIPVQRRPVLAVEQPVPEPVLEPVPEPVLAPVLELVLEGVPVEPVAAATAEPAVVASAALAPAAMEPSAVEPEPVAVAVEPQPVAVAEPFIPQQRRPVDIPLVDPAVSPAT